MADTQIAGDGWIGAVTGSVVIPPVPLNFDGGETFLIDVTLGTSFPIVSTVKDSNNLVTSITVTGSPTNGNGFCQALSAASASNIFILMSLASAAAVTGDIVMYTPGLRTQSLMTSAIGITYKSATYRSCSPVWKLYGDIHATSAAMELVNLTVIEDIVINAGRDDIIITTGSRTGILRRCIIQTARVKISGAASICKIENCIIWAARFNEGLQASGGGDIQIRHCDILRSRLDVDGTSTMSMDNTILAYMIGIADPDPAITGNFNWATDAITIPGANSLTSKDLDDLKLAHAETEVGGFPTGPIYGWFPTPAASFGFTGDPPTVLGPSDAERRDFYGNLRPSANGQTAGPVNNRTNDGGVAWGTYAAAVVVPPAPVIV